MFAGIWGDKPYRSTEMTLETEVDNTAATENAPNEDLPAKEANKEDEIVEDPLPVKQDIPEQSASSWWNYTAGYTAKLKETAQNMDYSKISADLSAKIGQTVNKESVTNATKGLGSYFNSMYKEVKTSVETIQKDGIGLPMLSEFEEEQKKFMKMQQRRQGAAIAPWIGYNEEEKMKKQILSLSLDERNVLRDPPAGVDFIFDMDSNMPVALAMLEIDSKLNDLRFKLVPKMIKEEQFWRNYFYRVSLIKQSAQLSSLEKNSESSETPAPVTVPSSEDPDFSFSPQEDEFISDHLSNYEDADEEPLVLNEEELQQIGLRKEGEQPRPADEDWEQELARELQDFDIVEDADGRIDTENFEAELEQMLQNQ